MRSGCPKRRRSGSRIIIENAACSNSKTPVAKFLPIRGCAELHRRSMVPAARPRSSAANHLDVHVIIDNLSAHKSPIVKRWLLRHPRFHLHFTPTYASWLNLVERFFGLLPEEALRRGS